jgi:hypothetical protein
MVDERSGLSERQLEWLAAVDLHVRVFGSTNPPRLAGSLDVWVRAAELMLGRLHEMGLVVWEHHGLGRTTTTRLTRKGFATLRGYRQRQKNKEHAA